MRKLLTLLLILLMVFTMVGCNTKEDTPIVQELEQQEVIEEAEIVGGYVDVEDGTLTDELKDIFSKALEGLTGAKYEPIELVATQVVAGINYKFLANGTKTTNPITKGTYYITIYKDLQDNVKLLDIETIEEKQEKTIEETKEEVDPEVLKTYKYWVVFFNPDGTELQREALKWGTTPQYYDGTPYYYDGSYDYDFVGWTNKKGQPKEFKPITGNTYFYATYEISTGRKGGSGGSNQLAPDPEYEVLTCLTTGTGDTRAYINSKVMTTNNMRFVFRAKIKSGVWTHIFGNWKSGQGICLHGFQNNPSSYGYDFYLGNFEGGATPTNEGKDAVSDFDYQVKSNDSFLKVNNNTLYTNANSITVPTSDEIYVFAQKNMNGGAVLAGEGLTIYYFKIYQNDVLVRDFIPVKTVKVIDKSKNANDNLTDIPVDTLCMYDKVNGMYYLNLGSTPFTTDPIN